MAIPSFLSNSEPDDLYLRVYREIRMRICMLDYPPGALLSEKALALEFDVSRPWLRGVLQRLEFERLLSHQAGDGFTVAADDIKLVKEAFGLRLRLYEVIADSASNIRLTQTDQATFEELLRKLPGVAASDDVRAYIQLHMAFHELFMKYVQNSILRDITNQLYYLTVRIWLRLRPEMSWEDEVETTTAEITQTVQALKRGDLTEAALARRTQLSIFVSRMMEYLGEAMVRVPDVSAKLERASAG